MTEAEATELYLSGLAPTLRVLLDYDKRVHEQQAKINDLERQLVLAKNHPSTPSGMRAAFTKANRASKPKKKKLKRRGVHRPAPGKVDQTKEHALTSCPACSNALPPPSETRVRFTEELPVVEPRVIKHLIHRYWCRACKKIVEAPVADALPKSSIGLRTVVYSAWLHYILGVSFDKIIQLLNLSAPSRLLWKIEKRNLWLRKPYNHASYQLATRRLRSHEVYQGRSRSFNSRGVAVFDGRPQ